MSELLIVRPIILPAPAPGTSTSARKLLANQNSHPRILVPFPVYGPKWANNDYAGAFPFAAVADSANQNDENGT